MTNIGSLLTPPERQKNRLSPRLNLIVIFSTCTRSMHAPFQATAAFARRALTPPSCYPPGTINDPKLRESAFDAYQGPAGALYAPDKASGSACSAGNNRGAPSAVSQAGGELTKATGRQGRSHHAAAEAVRPHRSFQSLRRLAAEVSAVAVSRPHIGLGTERMRPTRFPRRRRTGW